MAYRFALYEIVGGSDLPPGAWRGSKTPLGGDANRGFRPGLNTGLESGAHPGAARGALERAHHGQRNRPEQIECAATLVGA
jgi:hypothetical protein